MNDHDSKWHWEQGNRYAVEAIRTLLLLNGGAALALLAFEGSKAKIDQVGGEVGRLVGNSMVSFGVGALCAALGFMIAYYTQLQYGNSNWNSAAISHRCTYVIVVLSIFSFLVGLYFARLAIILQLGV